jgi:hypothetical protein
MIAKDCIRIDQNAARALIEWKYRFATETTEQACKIAATTSSSNIVGLEHLALQAF